MWQKRIGRYASLESKDRPSFYRQLRYNEPKRMMNTCKGSAPVLTPTAWATTGGFPPLCSAPTLSSRIK